MSTMLTAQTKHEGGVDEWEKKAWGKGGCTTNCTAGRKEGKWSIEKEVRQRYWYLYFRVFLVVCILSYLLFFGVTVLLFALFLVPSPSNRSSFLCVKREFFLPNVATCFIIWLLGWSQRSFAVQYKYLELTVSVNWHWVSKFTLN